MNDGTVIIDTELRTDDFEQSIDDLERELEDLEYVYETVKQMEPFEGQIDELHTYERQIKAVNDQLLKMKGIQSINPNQPTAKPQLPESKEVDNYLANTEKKLLKQTLTAVAVLGVLYAGATAIDKYLERNEETASRLKSIGQAFSNLASQIGEAIINFIGPYIDAFVEWLQKLVGYLNVFITTISGGKLDMSRNMAKNEKATEKTTKAIGKQAGAMKELNKQMAKFDEATVLHDNTSSGVAGGLDAGVGIGESVIDEADTNLDSLLDQDKVEKIQDFAEKVKEAALWIVDPVGQAKKLVESWKGLNNDLDNASKKGEKYYEVSDKIKDISGDISATTDKVATAFKYNTDHIQLNTNAAEQNANTIKDNAWVDNILAETLNIKTKLYTKNTEAIVENQQETQELIMNNRNLINNDKLSNEEKKKLIDTYIDERKALIKIRNQLPENSKAYKEIDQTIEMLGQDIRHYGDETQQATSYTKTLGVDSKKALGEVGLKWKDINDKLFTYNGTKLENKEATITIQTITTQAQNSLANLASSVADSFQRAFNKLDLFSSIRKQVSGMSSDVASTIRKVFGLAGGGIINLPGPGVPLGSGVVGGESAPEGVIPFTNAQVMETMGEAIGRYVTINATIVNSMNGRVISRELQKINNENTFMNNR